MAARWRLSASEKSTPAICWPSRRVVSKRVSRSRVIGAVSRGLRCEHFFHARIAEPLAIDFDCVAVLSLVNPRLRQRLCRVADIGGKRNYALARRLPFDRIAPNGAGARAGNPPVDL